MLAETATSGSVARGWRWQWPLVALGVCVAALAAAAWMGLRTDPPLRITGPSMADALLGQHGKLTCAQCSFVYRFDLQGVAIPDRLICPQCGRVHHDGAGVTVVPGDRVRIDVATRERGLARFDVVAFEVPGESQTLGVKRIVGLPGEQVAIRGGDIYIDGAVVAKDYAAQRATRLLVHRHGLKTSRWQPSQGASNWRHDAETASFYFDSGDDRSAADIEWVEYHHQRTHDSPGAASGGMLDNDPYNPALARQLNDVYDIGLELRAALSGALALRVHDGWREWTIELEPEMNRASLACGDQDLGSIIWPGPTMHDPDHTFQVELSLCDGRLSLWLDEELIVQEPLTPGAGPRTSSPKPLAFGALRGPVRINSLGVYRDIHYLDPVGLPRPWTTDRPLGAGEYFLLGDNVPVSTDSRHFGPVHREQILGMVRRINENR